MDPVKIRSMAGMIRKKFEGHTETVRQIVREMADTDLVAEYASFEAERIRHTRVKTAECIQKTPLRNLYARAVEAHS